MHVLYIKPPRKPKKALIVGKKDYQIACDIVSTMNVMKPKWKCEIVEAKKFGEGNDIIPLDVLMQAIIGPPSPVRLDDIDMMVENMMSMI
jgi:hypothetical protein|tara:strand:- start:63 stop:332 length:270 start_codon:yes stop_codon:yes gene_type:complete